MHHFLDGFGRGLKRLSLISALAVAATGMGCAAGDGSEVEGTAGNAGSTADGGGKDGAADALTDTTAESSQDADAADVKEADVADSSQDQDSSVSDGDAGEADSVADSPEGSLDGDLDGADGSKSDACQDIPEICDGLDNNCNGQKDEGDPGGGQTCPVPNKQGVCAEGTTHCLNSISKCVQNVPASAEVCDGKDNNCDGVVDNNPTDVGASCNTGKQGVCAAGTEKCTGGVIACEQNLQSSAEVCNGLDDDCNGKPDDGFSGAGQTCTVTGLNPNTPCAKGETNCLGGQNGCSQTVFPSSETCDGIDNDCDGTIDNPASVDNKSCQSGIPGECALGKTQCDQGKQACIPNIQPKTLVETCNGKDDDCNGTVDDVANIKLECATKFGSAQNVTLWQCTAGTCQVTGCSGSFKDCDSAPANGCEINGLTDTQHCGSCTKICDNTNGTSSCANGQCGITCKAGFGNCDNNADNGCELPVLADVNNCGACAKHCEDTTGIPSCTGGACGITCSKGLGNCDGNIVNGCETSILTSIAHCGKCAAPCSSVGGTPSCAVGVCKIACNVGLADCDGQASTGCEVTLGTDISHCGDCATACSNNNGTPNCNGGTCGITCNAGSGNCDGDIKNGCETNTQTTPTSCGSCGNICNSTNGTAKCVNGACGIDCAAGFADCDGKASNGCEVDLTKDLLNCGTCAKACSTNHGAASCTNGTCGITCAVNWDNCDGNIANGCEADLKNSALTCGKCSTQCSSSGGSPSCNNGVCGITCSAGFKDCNGGGDGCETNILTSLANCGGCGYSCGGANSNPQCSNGICNLNCGAGFASCDGNTSNGCETNIASNAANCGSCGHICSLANATSTCSAGGCAIVSCAAGYADCNGLASDGCEVNLTNDKLNCATCNHQCNSQNGTASCLNSACSISCNAGFGDCANGATDGCETNLSTTSNCKACGVVCNSTNGSPSCGASGCQIACNGGFGNCDNNAGNGCETNLTSSATNCGVCGTNCTSPVPANATGEYCSGGNCAISSCAGGTYNTDGSFSNGCECSADAVNDACAGATSLGTIALGATASTVASNNITPGTDIDWFQVSFNGNYSCSYHPKLVLNDVSGLLVMDVNTTACGSAAFGCGVEGGNATGKRIFEVAENNALSGCGYYGTPDPYRYPYSYSTFWVKVYKGAGSSASCLPYSITVSN